MRRWEAETGMGKDSNVYAQVVQALEDSIAVQHDYLTLLRALARHCVTESSRRRYAGKIEAAARRLDELRARRRALQQQIANGE